MGKTINQLKTEYQFLSRTTRLKDKLLAFRLPNQGATTTKPTKSREENHGQLIQRLPQRPDPMLDVSLLKCLRQSVNIILDLKIFLTFFTFFHRLLITCKKTNEVDKLIKSNFSSQKYIAHLKIPIDSTTIHQPKQVLLVRITADVGWTGAPLASKPVKLSMKKWKLVQSNHHLILCKVKQNLYHKLCYKLLTTNIITCRNRIDIILQYILQYI